MSADPAIDRIKAWLDAGHTKAAISEHIGRSTTLLGNLLTGKRAVTPDTSAAILDAPTMPTTPRKTGRARLQASDAQRHAAESRIDTWLQTGHTKAGIGRHVGCSEKTIGRIAAGAHPLMGEMADLILAAVDMPAVRGAVVELVPELRADWRDLEHPCTGRNEWISENPQVRAEAAQACGWCPAINACRNAGRQAGATAGVWGGHDFTTTSYQEAAA